MGGADSEGYTLRVLDAVALLGEILQQVDVVIGSTNPHRDEVAKRCTQDPRLRLHQFMDNPAVLMSAADFAVGAGGTSTWERACVGLPALILILAPNQRRAAESMAAAGAAMAVPGSDATPAVIADQIRQLTPALLRTMSARNLDLVDGCGVKRVLRVLLPPELALRPAREVDCEAVGAWRNDPWVRRYAHRSEPISKEDHGRWFAAAIRDPECALLIAEHDNHPVGVLRYDYEDTGARVSVYLVPGCSGHGYGTAILRAGNRWLHNHHPRTQRIVGEILPDNKASHYAFAEAGYRAVAGAYMLELCP